MTAQWTTKTTEVFLAWGPGHPLPKQDYYPIAYNDAAEYCWYPVEQKSATDESEPFPAFAGEAKTDLMDRALQECKRRNGKAYRANQGASNRLARG